MVSIARSMTLVPVARNCIRTRKPRPLLRGQLRGRFDLRGPFRGPKVALYRRRLAVANSFVKAVGRGTRWTKGPRRDVVKAASRHGWWRRSRPGAWHHGSHVFPGRQHGDAARIGIPR